MFRSFINFLPRKKKTFARTRVTVLTFRKASNIGKVWNPACCHGNKTVKLVYIPEFLKTGLAKIRAHFTTWQLKAIKSVQTPIKKPISDAEQ